MPVEEVLDLILSKKGIAHPNKGWMDYLVLVTITVDKCL